MIIHLLAAAVLSLAPVPSPPDHVFPQGLPWAVNEGSCATYRCVYDGRHQGGGQSMILTRWAGGYVAKPITHERAHRLQDAYCQRPDVACGYAN